MPAAPRLSATARMPTAPDARDACPECLRRAWLLQTLSVRLAYRVREPERLLQALGLPDEQLIQAFGGRRRTELIERHTSFAPAEHPAAPGVERVCRHDHRLPAPLRREGAPRMLHVRGGVERMTALLAAPTVAIVGAGRASDYGMEVAYGLARGLAASGVTVIGGLADGIAAAAHQGALRAGAAGVTVMAGGVDVPTPASWRELHRRIAVEGCALSELPCGSVPRTWCHVARTRTIAALARIVIAVEADDDPSELLAARLAQAAGATVAAVPGRVSAPGARGPHRLLREGALLVSEAQDVLDALYGVGERRAAASHPPLDSRLRAVLDRVSAGSDTVAKLIAADEDPSGPSERDVLLALAQLECSGAVVRGDGGQYLACV
ncbi:MAG TPA: DNA-processing protein DprA [Solirubrobacteraceae bacterium]|nr:DNA-processing protein DprA [Solirubrobacteraceae bacterium]